MTGNPIVAALPGPADQDRLLATYKVADNQFVVATFHRPENVDDASQLAAVLDGLGRLAWPVVLPLHPRTARRISDFGLASLAGRLRMTEPIDHRSFLGLVQRARLVVSDSGGVQEEITVLKKPMVVVRNSTERPEAVEAGFARMARPAEIEDAVAIMADPAVAARLAALPCPFGDGRAGERIAAATCLLADHRSLAPATIVRLIRR